MIRAYLASEIKRSVRNYRNLIFVLLIPVFMLLIFSSSTKGSRTGLLSTTTYVMISMATFAAMNGALSAGGRIAVERQTGWSRQLRLTPLSGKAYVSSKLMNGYCIALPAMAIVFLVGKLALSVALPSATWLKMALFIGVAMTPISLLGLFIGYTARPDNLQAISAGVNVTLSALGGLWFPAQFFPLWLKDLAKATPTYWIAESGRSAAEGQWIGATGTVVLVIWTLTLGAASMFAYEKANQRNYAT